MHITPVGKLVGPNLNVAKTFREMAGSKPTYYTSLDIEGEEGRQLEALIRRVADEHAKRNGKRSIDLESSVTVATDREGNEIADTTRFKFKSYIVKTKQGLWDRKPAFYAADGKPFLTEPQIGSGTIAQIAFTFYQWLFGGKPGITLQIEGLLIHELKEKGSSADRSYEGLFGGVSLKSMMEEFTPPTTGGGGGADF